MNFEPLTGFENDYEFTHAGPCGSGVFISVGTFRKTGFIRRKNGNLVSGQRFFRVWPITGQGTKRLTGSVRFGVFFLLVFFFMIQRFVQGDLQP